MAANANQACMKARRCCPPPPSRVSTPELNVKRNAIGNEGAAKVAQMLAGNSVQLLTRLYLEQNDIGGQGEYINEDHVSNSMLTIPTNEKTPFIRKRVVCSQESP